MMKIKKWLQSMNDNDMDIKERLFLLFIMIGLCVLVTAIITSIFIEEENIIYLTIALAVFAGITYFSFRFNKIHLGTIVIGVIIVYLVLPFTFLTSGAIYGGAPLYLLFGMVYIALLIDGKMKYIFLISNLLISAGCYYYAYTNPSLIAQHTLDVAFIDSIVSLFIIGIGVSIMLQYQNEVYRLENKIAREQKKEIEELNKAQNRFFSSMSHEIRTPINTIIGLNEIILRKAVTEEVMANAVNVQEASKMLLALINDFLDMSKIESEKMDIVPVTYDVTTMLSDIVNMIWVRTKEKGLEFHINVDESVLINSKQE